MSWHCAILLESDVAFFDTAEENLDQVLQQELRQENFSIMNLNGRQSLVLFQDVYCDYQLVANHIYNFLKREYMERFYLAVSRKFEGYENLPSVLEQLEQQMEEKFYHPDKHIFTNEDDAPEHGSRRGAGFSDHAGDLRGYHAQRYGTALRNILNASKKNIMIIRSILQCILNLYFPM